MKIIINNGQSINDAINKAMPGDILFIEKGIYNEKIKISKNDITIIGEDVDNTIIQNMDYSPKIHSDNKEYITFRTWTLMVASDNVTIKNITIKNLSIPATKYGQAVALHVLGNNFKLFDSKLLGDQDTLFCGPLPINLQERYIGFLPEDERMNKLSLQYYENVYIEGGIDFIFGSGTSIFNKCHFHSITDDHGYFFAPSHEASQEYGFTCFDCTFSGIKEHTMHLARPWRDYGKVTLLNSTILNNVISPDGWNRWNNTERYKTARFEEYNTNIDTSSFVSWSKHLTNEEASKYSINKILK